MALAEAAKEAVWMLDLLMELGLHNNADHVPIMEDNQGAIALAKNPEFHMCTKHIDVRHHYIQEVVDSGRITLHWILTTEQAADGLTKLLTASKFKRFIELIGLYKGTGGKEHNGTERRNNA